MRSIRHMPSNIPSGWDFSPWTHKRLYTSDFDRLFEVLKQLLFHTSGNLAEALNWLTQLDEQHGLTSEEYGIADFIKELKQRGYATSSDRLMRMTNKLELGLRKQALDDVFKELKKAGRGFHKTKMTGNGDERTEDRRPYEFGDALHQLDISTSIQNAHRQHGIENLHFSSDDLVVHETFHQTGISTVLMIDISHSMILYGEDRISPAKKVAMALGELITTRYPQDTLDVITFGDDAERIKLHELPYLQVGPYHTNTVAGLELALEILKKKKTPNKQIMMITDGKPSCIKKGNHYYKNSFGLDKQIVKRTLAMGHRCRKHDIAVTTFMIARDPYLIHFIERFTEVNQGRAFYSQLNQLGSFVFYDYKKRKRKL